MAKSLKTRIVAVVTATAFLGSMIATTNVFATTTERLELVKLKTDGLVQPLGIDDAQPEFSWQMDSNIIGVNQQSYQVIVKDNNNNVVWDSGVVKDSTSTFIQY